jgi:hypothetical protein
MPPIEPPPPSGPPPELVLPEPEPADGVQEMDSVRVMRLEAGDTIVLQIKEALSKTRADEVNTILQREFPGHKVLVLHGGWELSVLHQDSSASLRAPEGVTKAEYDRVVDVWQGQPGWQPRADPADPPAEEFPATAGPVSGSRQHLVGEDGPEQARGQRTRPRSADGRKTLLWKPAPQVGAP